MTLQLRMCSSSAVYFAVYCVSVRRQNCEAESKIEFFYSFCYNSSSKTSSWLLKITQIIEKPLSQSQILEFQLWLLIIVLTIMERSELRSFSRKLQKPEAIENSWKFVYILATFSDSWISVVTFEYSYDNHEFVLVERSKLRSFHVNYIKSSDRSDRKFVKVCLHF